MSACPWIASAAAAAIEKLGPLRLHPGLTLCHQSERLWIRGSELTPELAAGLERLPDLAWFLTDERGRLTPRGKTVPVGLAPTGPWRTIAAEISPELPVSAFSGRLSGGISTSLVRSEVEREAELLLLEAEVWRRFVLTAPLLRLSHLRYALADDDRAAVRGQPLPSLPGSRHWIDGPLALPLGFELRPALDTSTWRLVLRLAPDELALFSESGAYQGLGNSAFQDASRASVRRSFGGSTRV